MLNPPHKQSSIYRKLGGRQRMKRLLLAVTVTTAVMLSSGQSLAHHSFAATYFEDKTEKIEGTLVQFLFRNPHSFVHVEVKGENGEIQRWAVEWGGGDRKSVV